jgi:hypothetical protein
VEAIILAGDYTAGDVIVLPGTRDAVLVKQVRLGQGGFILTVVPVDEDSPGAERLEGSQLDAYRGGAARKCSNQADLHSDSAEVANGSERGRMPAQESTE